MSGFTRDTKHYGDQLVYEALLSKWDRYHARCGCDQDWVTAHAEPAGFTVVRTGGGYVALVGPGLTQDVDESRLTANALWEAVTGQPGQQTWFEQVQVLDRSPEAEAEEAEYYREMRARSAAKKKAAQREPATDAQRRYLTSLAKKDSDLFDAELAKVLSKARLAPRSADEDIAGVLGRLTKDTARTLLTALLGK